MNTVRPIRVLHLGSPSGLYGAERWILALVRYLPAHVESIVSVLKDAPHYEAELCVQAARLGVRTHVFEAYGRLSLAAVYQLRRYVQSQAVDVIHTHGYKTDLIGLLATRGTSCRIISTPHGWSANAGLVLRLYEVMDRCSFLFMDAVAPLSEDLQRELMRLPGLRNKLHLIRNGVDLSEVHTAPDICSELNTSRQAGETLVGYIGQLIPRKGIDCLIRALAKMGSSPVRLCLIGEGAQRPELEQLAAELGVKDRVSFFGYRADRLALLKQFDIFALPSWLEGIPRCVLEAMAANVAVIATDIPGCRDVVRHEDTGLLTPAGDVAALAAGLERLVHDRALRSALARAGRELVEAEFSAATMAKRYVDLYEMVVRNGAPAGGVASSDSRVPG